MTSWQQPQSISRTLDEQLFYKYHCPTRGMAEGTYQFLIDARCQLPLSRKELEALNKKVVIHAMVIFGAKKFSTLDNQITAEHIAPDIGGSGWKRYPGLDHWHVTDASGKTLFRTQNYGYVLQYFKRRTSNV